MKSHDQNADDLLVLARRGDLVDGDERKLRDALGTSPEARALYDAGLAFDAETSVLAGDDERIERIARNVEKRLAKKGGFFQRRRWVLQLAVAAALLVGVAIAARELTPKPPPLPPTPSIEATHVVDIPPPEPVVVQKSEEPPEVVKPEAPAPSAAPAPQRQGPSAAELFRAANLARMEGENARAIDLSRQLEDRYPTSAEAKTTHLSLGMLLLQSDRAAEALRELKLAHDVGGATVPDALWGEAQALRRLGRSSDERAALDELLTAYPQSAYAGAAKKRLAELP
jgi:hypothetical protein